MNESGTNKEERERGAVPLEDRCSIAVFGVLGVQVYVEKIILF